MKELKPRRAYFTHICHDLPHEKTEASLPENVHLAYDGLEIDVGDEDRPERRRGGSNSDRPAVTIGNFDGVHAGHQHLFREVVQVSRERGVRPTVLTFDPHPAAVVAPERAPRLLTTRRRALRADGSRRD